MSVNNINESIKELDRYKGEEIKDLTQLRHVFMKEYGWIPEKEFYNESSIGEILKLSKYIYVANKKVKDDMDKAKKKKHG